MGKNKEESKNRILTAAMRLFAEKGYDGACMDEIARKAKVNKALIYYYFKSKKAVLNELFSTFFRESTELLLRFIERGGFKENAEENKRLFDAEYSTYLETNRDILKILVAESLKSNIRDVPLFKLVDVGGNVDDEKINKIKERVNIPHYTQQQMYVTEFFTGVIPFVCYIVFKEKWCDYFHITKEELAKYFDAAMEATHERHHRNMEEGKG
ncbi:MAG: TetR/AcrR family transcriptional regulator [Spirochaetales bacterium]|nr:TetR/AcrR family transcriptional regulator [Spirochaetales bacterium]